LPDEIEVGMGKAGGQGRPLRVGDFAAVKIERATTYDLHGVVVGF